MNKKKILWVSESSSPVLETGFSNITRGMLDRLYVTNKYEIAEFGSYAKTSNPKAISLPWKFYGAIPEDHDDFGKQRYNSSMYGQFGEAMFEQVCIDFKPDIVCVPPDTLVMTSCGHRPIQSIQIGDKVLTHKNRFMPVTRTMSRKHTGKMIEIKISGIYEKLKLTPEHPILVYRKRNQTNQKKSINKIYNGVSPEFVQAKDVKKGDLVIIPKLIDGQNQYIKYFDKEIAVTPDLARLIGYILGDGKFHIDGTSGISFDSDEKEFAIDTQELLLNYFGVQSTLITERNIGHRGNYILIDDLDFSRWAKEITNNKTNIPKFLWLSDLKTKQQLLVGLIRTDGHYNNKTVAFSNQSSQLAFDVRVLFISLGYPSTIVKYINDAKVASVSRGTYVRELHNLINKYTLNYKKRKTTKGSQLGHIVNGHAIYTILDINEIDYNDYVYNLEVLEDNSYTIQCCVHNCDLRDFWMIDWQLKSPFRKYFKLLWMPTTDSGPQAAQWLDSYSQADLLLTYCRYGKEIFARDSGNTLKVFDVALPGADTNIFKPLNKQELRKKFGIPDNAKIVMTTMRNQRRKLFPDLIETFAEFLNYCKSRNNKDLEQNTYLYLHTSFPDVGFDIAKHILRNGVGHRVLCTYLCERCKSYYPDFFQTELSTCKKCGAKALHMPNTNNGVSREQLAEIYNLADIYIQYSIAESLACPIIEAKACGIPVAVVDYAAMSEQAEVEGCTKIKVGHLFHEPVIETEQIRALPDNTDAAFKMYEMLSYSKEHYNKISQLVRKDAVDNHSYDRAAKIFEKAIDSLEIHNPKHTWYSPLYRELPEKIEKIPKFNSPSQLVDWCFVNILKHPELKDSYWRHELIKSLNVGFTVGRQREKCTPESVMNMFFEMSARNNYWERQRLASIGRGFNKQPWSLV